MLLYNNFMNKIILGFFISFSLFLLSLGVVENAQAQLQYNYLCKCNNGSQLTVTSCTECVPECARKSSTRLSCDLIASTNVTPVNPPATVNTNNTNIPQLTNPLNISSPQALLGQVLNGVFGIIGSLALVMFIFGGLTWMVSAGNPEKVKKGRDMLIWAAIGLFIVFSAYALVRFLLDSIIPA